MTFSRILHIPTGKLLIEGKIKEVKELPNIFVVFGNDVLYMSMISPKQLENVMDTGSHFIVLKEEFEDIEI